MLRLGMLEGDEEGCAEVLGDPDGPDEGAMLRLGTL